MNLIKSILLTLMLILPIVSINSYVYSGYKLIKYFEDIENTIVSNFPISKKVAKIITTESYRNDVDPYLTASLVYKESRGRQYALGLKLRVWYKGKPIIQRAIGYMQILPVYHGNNLSKWQLFKPEINIAYGTKYLRKCLDMSNGDIIVALKNYNSGPNSKIYNWTYINEIINNFGKLSEDNLPTF